MSRLRLELVRFRSVATAIGRALEANAPPDCRMAHGRITLTFRHLGASRWPEARQMEHALRAVAVARTVLADDRRRTVRRGATWAIVVVFEDANLVQGCAVVTRWECVVPAASTAVAKLDAQG